MKRTKKTEPTEQAVVLGPQPFYTVPETARLLRQPKPTIYRWVSQGQIPSRRIGGRVLVEREPIDDLLEKVDHEVAAHVRRRTELELLGNALRNQSPSNKAPAA